MLLTFVNTFANVLAGSVTGKIVDSRTNQPVEYATVALYNQANNSLVTGTITDGQGKFTIDGLKNGTYILKASFIGYDQLEMRDIVVDGGVKQLGTIKLSTSDAEIGEVEVVAKKKDISYQLDKKVINLSTDISADNGSAADALEGVPSVDVDIDGNVSLRGSSNFTVLIDGKPTALDAADVLKQTPAAMIENIEIITNPSAKYDPEGTTGIINLVTKKNVIQGLNGVVNANVGSQGRVGGDFLLNKRSGKVNFFVGGYINQRGNKFHGESSPISMSIRPTTTKTAITAAVSGLVWIFILTTTTSSTSPSRAVSGAAKIPATILTTTGLNSWAATTFSTRRMYCRNPTTKTIPSISTPIFHTPTISLARVTR